MVNRNFLQPIAAAFLAFLLLLGAACPAFAENEPKLASETAVLMVAETGQVLFSKNAHQKMYPASITKIMTGMLALQALEPEQILTASHRAVQSVPITSSQIWLEPGQTMTMEEAMYALALESANDAANVLAEAVSGSLEAFAEKMTETAQALGAVNTHFANANGLPDSEHYTTAYDMALITAAALNTPGFADYFGSTEHAGVGGEYYTSHNRMLNGSYRYEGVLISKTGWTSSALGTLVTAVRQGETTLIAVVMKSLFTEEKYQDTWALLNYGFGQFAYRDVPAEEIVTQLEHGNYYPIPGQKMAYLLPLNTDSRVLTFSLGEGMNLVASEAEQTAVVVTAAMGDMKLPDTTLIMVPRPSDWVEPETEPVEEPIEIVQPPEMPPIPQELIPTKYILIGGIAVLFWLVYSILARRRRERRHRRRQLDGQLRVLKKRLEE